MEDTYLLYLPAPHSVHVALDVAPVALYIRYRKSQDTHIHPIEYRDISERDEFSHMHISGITQASGLVACSEITRSTYSHIHVFSSELHTRTYTQRKSTATRSTYEL